MLDHIRESTADEIEKKLEKEELVNKINEFYDNLIKLSQTQPSRAGAFLIRAAILRYYLLPDLFEENPMTVDQIGKEHGISGRRVSQLYYDICNKLGHFLMEEGIIEQTDNKKSLLQKLTDTLRGLEKK